MTFYAHAQLPEPLGQLLLISDDGQALTGLYFSDQPHAPQKDPSWENKPDTQIFVDTIQQLQQFLLGERREFTIPYRFTSGTEFQQDVWNLLPSIPYGTTSSYMRVAVTLLSHRAARAVGAAVSRNPISIIIPCHRVIGINGELTGYAGGLERKKALLALEKLSQ